MIGNGAKRNDYSGIVQMATFVAFLLSPWTLYQLVFSSHNNEYLFAGSDPGSTFIVIAGATALYMAIFMLLHRDDSWLQMTIVAGLLLKLTAAAIYLYVCFEMYQESADVVHYVNLAKSLMATYETTGVFPILKPFYSTNFVIMGAAAGYAVFGTSIAAVSVLFSLASFWGQYFLYRAFCMAYPSGNRRLAAVLCLLTPSLIFWTAAVGKDALISPGVGLCCYGFARMTRRPGLLAVVSMAAGFGIMLLVRPHIALIVAIAVAVAYLLGYNLVGVKGMLAKIVAIPLLIAACLYLAVQASQFLDVNDFSTVRQTVVSTGRNNKVGGSAVMNSLPVRIAYTPFLLFRPFPWEARSLQSAAASAEGLLLMWLFWKRRRQVYWLVRTSRHDPFRLFLFLFTVEACLMMAAAMTNFGLIARQREMVLGPALLFLAMPPVLAKVRAPARTRAPMIIPPAVARGAFLR